MITKDTLLNFGLPVKSTSAYTTCFCAWRKQRWRRCDDDAPVLITPAHCTVRVIVAVASLINWIYQLQRRRTTGF